MRTSGSQANGTTNNLAKATAYTTETVPASKLSTSGGYTPDGKPGVVAPIGEEKKSTSVVKNVNLPKSIGKVFFVDSEEQAEVVLGHLDPVQVPQPGLHRRSLRLRRQGQRQVMDNWVFVPGYYQGKTPWGIYVGKTAYVHYDFDVYNDRDRDYAFVTVYNGIQVGGGTTKDRHQGRVRQASPARRIAEGHEDEYTDGSRSTAKPCPYKGDDF